MSKLKLLELRCNESEDSGGDEAYITVDGKKVWSTDNIENGESVSLRSVKAIDFGGEVTVALWDKDTGLFDSDDNLGEFTVSADLEGEDEQEYNFKGDGVSYLLVYKVIED
jgi:hypothetical protein